MKPVHSISRRTILLSGAASFAVASLVSNGPAAARTPSPDHKLIIVILRGAMDGLAALPKIDDPDIRTLRGPLIDAKAALLSDGFALHSAMPGLASLYAAKQAAFVPAVAGPYRERSHFMAQDLLECGAARIVSQDGWLNRALQRGPDSYSAVAIGPVQPLILRGAATDVSSWSPPVLPEASDDTINRLMEMYEADPLLKASLGAGVGAGMIAGDMNAGGMGGGRGGPAQYVPLMTAAGKFLAQPDGPQIAVVSLEGWDTHTGQNGALNQRFQALDNAISAVRRELGAVWDRTTLLAVSEFGRTARMNGGQGTDHGTAGLAILAGGAVRGGRIVGDWPGLKPSALFENRDLAPATDMRSLFKGLLRDHMGWSAADLDGFVFPDSAAVPAASGLV